MMPHSMEMPHTASTQDPISARITALRAYVCSHKQRALDLWNASSPQAHTTPPRATVGRFTQQLVEG